MFSKKQLIILSGIMIIMLVVVIVLSSLAWYIENERVDSSDTAISSQEVATITLVDVMDVDPDKASYNGETAVGYYGYVWQTGLPGYTYVLDRNGSPVTRSFVSVDTVIMLEGEPVSTIVGAGLVYSGSTLTSYNTDGTRSTFVFASGDFGIGDEPESATVFGTDGGILYSTENGNEIGKIVTSRAFYAVTTATSADYAYTMGKTFSLSVTLNPYESYREMYIAPKKLVVAPIFHTDHVATYLAARAADPNDGLEASDIYYTRLTYLDGAGTLKSADLYSLTAPTTEGGTVTYSNGDGTKTVYGNGQISIINKDGSPFEYEITSFELESSTAYIIPENELYEHYTWTITFQGDPNIYYPASDGSGKLVYFDANGTELSYHAVASNLQAEITLYFMDYASFMNAMELVYNYNAATGAYTLDPTQINADKSLTVKGTDRTVEKFNFSDYCYMGSTYIVYLAINTQEAS